MERKSGKIILFLALFLFVLDNILIAKVMAEPPKPFLSAIVLFGMPPLKEIKKNRSIKADKCFRKYLKAIPPESYLLSAAGPSGTKDALNYRRRNLEEQIVVIMGEKTRDEARSFSQAVPLCIEWEGMSEGPLDEANFVDNWLLKRPDTSIAQFLYLFKAHRLRAAYESARACYEKGLWPVLAVKYKETLNKIRSSENSLIPCIARSLEVQPYVYLEGYGRP
ncbi:hypothetical protein SMITH_415 [Smithella sp. ME-1]|uniref:Uncharacterized protein n=1 Tax=hydrocarbon metagenome TaxID=938273 RepID=A0A0W8FQ07_9ZZZZ|nr:hypothetical protein SMITH_415 [Smithella sp. ME-1]